MKRAAAYLLSFALLAACGGETESYDPAWGEDLSVPGGKADFLEDAPVLSFDEPGTGSVDSEHLDIFQLELTRGDEIQLVKTVTDGDLAPDFGLYRSVTSAIGSDSYEVGDQRLTKNYKIHDSGTYLVAVRAYQNRGSGSYSLRLTCIGGTCDGAPVPPASPEEMTFGDAVDCVSAARRCSFRELPSYNGRVGAVTAQRIFDGCLAEEMTWDDLSCARACEYQDDVSDHCDSIVAQLPFFADQSEACLGELDYCLGDCHDFANDYGYGDEMYETAESMCWTNGFNGDCVSFARSISACGGAIEDETAYCYKSCYSTTGATYDDLDTICRDDCGTCGIACARELEGGDLWTSLPEDGLVGDVTESGVVEVDPMIIGDACIVYVAVHQDGDGELPAGRYGLVADESSCQGYYSDFEAGNAIHVPMNSLTEPTADALDELERMEDVRWFMFDGEVSDLDVW